MAPTPTVKIIIRVVDIFGWLLLAIGCGVELAKWFPAISKISILVLCTGGLVTIISSQIRDYYAA